VKSYFASPFHTFDALVILTAFIVDLVLHAGPLEEAGSLVVVLRLWRVFKIIEEFSSGAEDQLAELQERIDELVKEKEEVVKQNEELKVRLGGGYQGGDGNGTDGVVR
jgi:voltage-gated hydrogen channel 1